MERALIHEFEQQIDFMLGALTAGNLELATEIVNEYLEIRGYGPVKEQAAAEARARIESRLSEFIQVPEKAA